MDKNVRLQRTQSILKETVQEAICSLADSRINRLTVTDAVCHKGKYDAEIFIQADDCDERERKEILSRLRRAEGILKEYVLNASGWFKCPSLRFCFDESLQRSKNLDEIFEKIAKTGKKKEDEND